MVGILPVALARFWAGLERAGIFIVLGALFVVPMVAREFGLNIDPVRDGLAVVLPWALRLIFSLAGYEGAFDADSFDL